MPSTQSATPMLVTRPDAGIAVLRTITGAVFIGHGMQKVFTFGLAGTAEAFGGMGVPLSGLAGPGVALLELLGGIALVLGVLTRPVAAGLAGTMLGAMILVHLPNGFYPPNGVAYPLALFGATLSLALTGAGAFSLDRFVSERRAWRAAAGRGTGGAATPTVRRAA